MEARDRDRTRVQSDSLESPFKGSRRVVQGVSRADLLDTVTSWGRGFDSHGDTTNTSSFRELQWSIYYLYSTNETYIHVYVIYVIIHPTIQLSYVRYIFSNIWIELH